MERDLINFTGKYIPEGTQAIDIGNCPGLRNRERTPASLTKMNRYVFLGCNEKSSHTICPVGGKEIFIDRKNQKNGTLDCIGCPYFKGEFSVLVDFINILDISILNLR